MSALGSLVVSLNANIAKFESAMSRANYVANRNMQQISKDVSDVKSSLDALPGSIMRFVGASAAIAGVAYVLKKAISAADEFRVATIGIAAGLTNIAKPGQGSFESIFKRNLAYAKEMNKELERVAARTPAEPAEMMMAYNQLVQQGYAARLDEADALGVVVTRIKLATVGQDANKQINQEIRALMQGQAVAGSMIAQELQSRLGPAWTEIINKQKESGTLLKYLAGLWPGVAVAGEEFEKTLQAQGTTLQGHLKYLGREGLGGLYDDLVKLAADLNEFLKKHEDLIAGGIARGWTAVKDIAGGVYGVFSSILGILVQMVSETAKFVSFWSGLGSSGPWQTMARWLSSSPSGTGDMFGGALTTFGQQGAQEFNEGFVGPKQRQLTIPLKAPAIAMPKVPGAGGKGGGGKIQEVVSAAEAAFKQLELIEKISNNIYDEAERAIKRIDSAMETRSTLEGDYLSLQKEQFDSLSQISPVLTDQIAFKKRALDLEIQIGQAAFDKKMTELETWHIISKAQADELRGLKALENQQKRYNQEMENNKGLTGWAYSRANEVSQRNPIKDMMGDLESGFQNAFSSGLQGVLNDDKATLKNIGKTMFNGLLGEITKRGITKLFDTGAKMLKPATPQGLVGTGGNVAGELGQAAQGLQKASVGFNANAAQFGLAAGGLLLSGIGIAANSQALVYAGAVLQIAGLAIQLYEMLTATTTVASMTMAAGALTASAGALSAAATMLMMAAAVETIPFFHSGGLVYAHSGWPRLRSDEVPIIAQTGERVLSRRQNRDYEAGGGGIGGGGTIIHAPITFAPIYSYRPTQADMDRDAKMMVKAINKNGGVGARGQKLGDGRY